MVRALDTLPAPALATDLCDHCGLATTRGDRYCCYGCELGARIGAEAERDHGWQYNRLLFAVLLTMMVMMLSLFLYAGDVYDAGDEAGMVWLRTAHRWATALFSTPVVLLLGIPLARRAGRHLWAGHLSMGALICSGAFAAYGLSMWALFSGGNQVYFDSATAALVLATAGRYAESLARTRASRMLGPSLELARAPVAVWDGTTWALRSPAVVEAGDRVQVAVEQAVPVDLRAEGEAQVSFSVVTGEPEPRGVVAGDEVPAGAVVFSGSLTGVALRPARESTLERLAKLAASLHASRPRWVRLADRFAAALVPVVWLSALGAFVVWTRLGTLSDAVVVGLAVVLAACPCTYAIAAPLVTWLTMRRLLNEGVLVRDAGALEELARVGPVAFDKTGTLTEITLVESAGAIGVDAASLVVALEAGLSHPIARALREAAGDVEPATLAWRQVLAGSGVAGALPDGTPVELRAAGDGDVVLLRDGVEAARYRLGEQIRQSAAPAIRALQAEGRRTLILTGDIEARAAPIAASLGMELHAACSPEEKVEHLRGLGEPAAVVGDGLNDAPALASAGLGFAVSEAAGLARGLARVTLLEPDLRLVPWTLSTARRASRLTGRLLAWATIYNLVFVSLAACGLLLPVWAGLSMLISSLASLGAAVQIATWRPPQGATG